MTNQTGESAALIREALTSRRITHRRVAAAIGKTPATTSRKLSGRIPISLDELHKIADLLNVPVASLLGEEVSAK